MICSTCLTVVLVVVLFSLLGVHCSTFPVVPGNRRKSDQRPRAKARTPGSGRAARKSSYDDSLFPRQISNDFAFSSYDKPESETVLYRAGLPKLPITPFTAQMPRQEILEFVKNELGSSVKVHFNESVSRPSLRCKPFPTLISLEPSADQKHVKYVPNCVQLKLCGGCSNNNARSCQPTEVTLRKFTVSVSGRKEKIQLLEHVKCAMRCNLLPKNCSPNQSYNDQLCSCECPNKRDKQTCLQEPENKRWNSTKCGCECREKYECSTGLFFNSTTCQCSYDFTSSYY